MNENMLHADFHDGGGTAMVDRLNLAIPIHRILLDNAYVAECDPKFAAELAFRHADALLAASKIEWEKPSTTQTKERK